MSLWQSHNQTSHFLVEMQSTLLKKGSSLIHTALTVHIIIRAYVWHAGKKVLALNRISSAVLLTADRQYAVYAIVYNV